MKKKTVIVLGSCLIILLSEFSKPGQLKFDAPFLRELYSITTQTKPSAKVLATKTFEILEDKNFGLSKEQIDKRDSAKTESSKCEILKFSKLDSATVLVNIQSQSKTTIEEVLGVSQCSQNGYMIYKSSEFEIRVKYDSKGDILDYEPKGSTV